MARDEASKSILHSAFRLNGQTFMLMEGQGIHGITFNEATSLIVYCETQDEIDRYWRKLTEGGSESQCGWLKDKYGVSWQIVPTILSDLAADPTRAEKTMKALLKMSKLDIAGLIAGG
jgi:predicted 3-demethylubiquinone-9 3-methyltransferase (glyoxalase superfamily)